MESPSILLKKKVLEDIDHFGEGSGSGHIGSIPKFDYYALDYLEFAGLNLEAFRRSSDQKEKENNLMGFVLNLKRAIANQIECFLESWNLRNYMSKKNLGLDKKLSFLSDAGFFSSRAIDRFATLRNKVEHNFQRPNIVDSETLYDLVTALVALLQNGMTSAFSEEIQLAVCDETGEKEIGFFEMGYKAEARRFYARWGPSIAMQPDVDISVGLDSQNDFAYFFRVLALLNQRETFASREHLQRKLRA